MRYGTVIAVGLWLVFASWQGVAQDEKPRLSATDTEYLSCSVWTGKEWTPLTSRSSRTPMFESPKGYRAYAEVRASVNNESCDNSLTLYVASGETQPFKIAQIEPRSGGVDGNGIRIIGWSASGDKLLAELSFWKYATDGGFSRVPLVYDALTRTASEIGGLGDALTRQFGSDCEFEPLVEGWGGNGQILVKVSRTPKDNSQEKHFCVGEPQLFVYDLREQSVLTVGLLINLDETH